MLFVLVIVTNGNLCAMKKRHPQGGVNKKSLVTALKKKKIKVKKSNKKNAKRNYSNEPCCQWCSMVIPGLMCGLATYVLNSESVAEILGMGALGCLAGNLAYKGCQKCLEEKKD